MENSLFRLGTGWRTTMRRLGGSWLGIVGVGAEELLAGVREAGFEGIVGHSVNVQ